MPYTNRFFLFLIILAGICAVLWAVILYVMNAIAKKTAAKVEVEHDFEDKVADYEIEKLKIDKAAELKKARRKILGAAK
jgi:cell division septal protein FtsQ